MAHVNVEIKARCGDPEKVRAVLQAQGAEFRGLDRQTDVYFNVPRGRLKLRCGDIENALIYYNRPDNRGPKQSDVCLCPCPPESGMEALFTELLGVRVRVVKEREIYFIDNVKFHIDTVDGLGGFVEIEAIDADGNIGRERLLDQCRRFMTLLEIDDADLIDRSYSDMLMEDA
jgi:predicted adenylyl cyclase CyaB